MKKIILYTAIITLAATFKTLAQTATTSFDVDGIKVIFKPSPKNIVDVQVFFRGGVTNYTAKQAGIETLTLDALTKCGTKKYEANNFNYLADNYGIVLFGSSTYDYGVVRFNCITKYFDQGWDLLSDAIVNPVFDATQLELLKNKIISVNKNRSSTPAGRLNQMLMQNAFKDTPYAIDPHGNEETLSALTQSDISNYYKTILNKNRLFIVVVGNLTKEQVINKIHTSFAALPSLPYTPYDYNLPLWNDNKLLTEKRALATNYISAVSNCPPVKSPMHIPFEMGVTVLSGQLFLDLRTRLNLSYDPGASLADLLMPYCRISVSTNDPKKAVEEIVSMVKRTKRVTLSDEMLNHIKNNFILYKYLEQQNTGAIADNLGEAEINGSWQDEESFIDRVNNVTGQDITKALNTFLLGLRWNYLGNTELASKATDAFNMPLD